MGRFQVTDLDKQVFAAVFLALLLLLTGAPSHAAVLRVNGHPLPAHPMVLLGQMPLKPFRVPWMPRIQAMKSG